MVFMDHAPLRALRQSTKVASWPGGLVWLLKLGIEFQYKPGRKNANADTLYWAPLPACGEDGQPVMHVMEVSTEEQPSMTTGVDVDVLTTLQAEYKYLQQVYCYLLEKSLPTDDKRVKRLVLSLCCQMGCCTIWIPDLSLGLGLQSLRP